jgi:replication factor C subunit 1
MFGSEPVKRKERSKAEKKGLNNSKSIIDLEDDDDADVSIVLDQLESTKVKTPKKEIKKEVFKEEKKSSTKKSSEKKKRNKSKSPSPQKSPPNETVTNSSKKVRKVKEFSVEEDEARQERKQAALALYHKMKSRPTCLNHGCKEIPKGSPDCLKGLQFVISGVLESMEREEASDLIKSHGGNVVSGLSKKVTHMLVGEEAGPAKIAKAETMGIKQISEDELLDLIRKNSDIKVKSPVKETKVKVEKSEVLKDSPGKENKDKNEEDKKKSPPAKKIKTDPTPIIPSTSTSSTSSISSTKPEYEFSFVDKYKPTAVKNIVGQQGPSGNATKLMNWLSKWYKNNDGTKKHSKPNPWAKDNDGSAFKAALLSGPPGVGKTTTAHLVSRELQFDVVEFNASDTRSKKLLKEEVSSLLSNTSMHGYAIGASAKPSKRRVLIMDEVDGMAGNEDRGGVAELIGFIKESQVPIICMCNDRNHPKIRSLANYCFDLRFYKPSTQQIRGAMMSVCFKEGIKIEPTAVDEIINGTGNDIRQTLNHLALYSASKNTKIVTADAKKTAKSSEKDIKIVS